MIERLSLYGYFETRWIAASLTSFPPRNDRESVVLARALRNARGDPLVLAKRTDKAERQRCMQWIAPIIACLCHDLASRGGEDGAGTRDRTEDTSLEGWGFTTKLCPLGKADYHYGVDALGQVVIACFQDKSNVLAT